MDPITEMLNRIRNAQAVSKEQVEIPFSNFKFEIARILEKHNFVKNVEKKGRKNSKVIEIALLYTDKTPAISGLKRISKPGQRIYRSFKELRSVKSGYGIAIISTPKGLMVDKEARRQKLGGEMICEVW